MEKGRRKGRREKRRRKGRRGGGRGGGRREKERREEGVGKHRRLIGVTSNKGQTVDDVVVAGVEIILI